MAELIGDDGFAVTFIIEMMRGAGYRVQVCPIYGDIAEAIARYKQAVADDPDYISAYDSQGRRSLFSLKWAENWGYLRRGRLVDTGPLTRTNGKG